MKYPVPGSINYRKLTQELERLSRNRWGRLGIRMMWLPDFIWDRLWPTDYHHRDADDNG